MPTEDLTDDEKALIEAFRAADDPDVDDDHLAIAEAVATETDLSRADLLEASPELVATIAERTRVADVDTRHAGDSPGADPAAVADALTANRAADAIEDLDIAPGAIDEAGPGGAGL